MLPLRILLPVVVAVLVAIVAAAPLTPAAGVALLALVAAAGAGAARLTPTRGRPRRPPAPWLVWAALVLAAAVVFLPVFARGVRWRTGDWGAHHVLTRELLRGLSEQGRVPRWVLAVSTGDPSFETYPLLTYLLAAGATLLTGARDHVPMVLLGLGVAAHLALALLVAWLALRLGSWWAALAVGVLALLDLGSFDSGGVEAVLGVGLLHAAVAQCFTTAGFVAVVDYLGRPRLAAAVVIWLAAALGAAAHPSGLLFMAAWLPALAVTAAVVPRLRLRRAAAAALHVAIGAGASAWVWWPFSRRVLAYGLPFGYRAPSLWAAFADVVSLRAPATSFPIVLALGLAGGVIALAARRPRPVFVAVTAVVLLVAYADAPYLLLAPGSSPAFARLQTFRFLALARPLLFALAAHALSRGVAVLHARPGASYEGAGRAWAGAVAAVAIAVGVRAAVPLLAAQVAAVRDRASDEVPDPDGFHALVDWARQQAEGPGRFGRVLFEGDSDSNWIDHVTAETGLPVFILSEGVAMLDARERIADASPESLRRFDVRWILAKGHPPSLGAPATERRLGRYFVREWEGWDGRLARVEKGNGEAVVTAADDARIVVELSGTEPALVALGTGYYGRWRAHTSDGRELPVYAVPATSGGGARVPAAWARPGRITFTPDGHLESDGQGRAPAVLAITVALAIVLVSRRSRWRRRSARTLVAGDRALLGQAPLLRAAALVAGSLALAFWAARSARTGATALQLGTGLDGGATVEARAPGAGSWAPCRFSRLSGTFRCGIVGGVGAGTASAMAGGPLTNPYVTPAIMVWPERAEAEFRLRLSRRLQGDYAVALVGKGAAADVRVDGGPPVTVTRERTRIRFEGEPAPRSIEIVLTTPEARPFGIVFVREDTLDRDRSRDVPWAPETPPAGLGTTP